MEQMRAFYKMKNRTTMCASPFELPSLRRLSARPRRDDSLIKSRYYVMSVIMGTVAFSYGSVPFYKMVSSLAPTRHPL